VKDRGSMKKSNLQKHKDEASCTVYRNTKCSKIAEEDLDKNDSPQHSTASKTENSSPAALTFLKSSKGFNLQQC
jgi:hypothetical protein